MSCTNKQCHHHTTCVTITQHVSPSRNRNPTLCPWFPGRSMQKTCICKRKRPQNHTKNHHETCARGVRVSTTHMLPQGLLTHPRSRRPIPCVVQTWASVSARITRASHAHVRLEPTHDTTTHFGLFVCNDNYAVRRIRPVGFYRVLDLHAVTSTTNDSTNMGRDNPSLKSNTSGVDAPRSWSMSRSAGTQTADPERSFSALT